MNVFLLILLIGLIKGQISYDLLINENATEEYCTNVINNITSLINDGYVYYDFLRAPKQPEGYPDYISKIDLIDELNKINVKNRTFYDFYRDLENVLEKSKDGHLSIYAENSPRFFELNGFVYCIPFKYSINEIKEGDEVIDAEMILEYTDKCKEGYTNEIINKIKSLNNKKIIKINDMNPFEYIDSIGNKGFVLHSPQARYVYAMKFINQLPINIFPFKKEELKISIQFEGIDEPLQIQYQFIHKDSLDNKKLVFNQKTSNLKSISQKPLLGEVDLNLDIKEEKLWNIISNDSNIKCKIDDSNLLNVLYIKSYNPKIEDYDNYENTMNECFSKFYSNNYTIVIINSENNEGNTELCFPFVQYVQPKISKLSVISKRATDLITKNFFKNDKIVNPETCLPYTEKDKINEGKKDKYSDDIFHQRTKDTYYLNIFQKKLMEKKRREYLDSLKIRKPTEIIVFTDGFSFGCGSIFIKELQMHGTGIIVGYNTRPDLAKSKYDASQSDSQASTFEFSKNSKNLKNLGFNVKVTIDEHFDPNDLEDTRVPTEFKIYPIDKVSNIYLPFSDNLYERFIGQARNIFEKYNNLENGECNKDNKYLYYETEECDKILNIENGHGGYICGSDGKWNKSQCIATYCDVGFILNDERTKCIKDPCDSIKLTEISISDEKEQEFDIEPSNIYIFTIDNEKLNYSIYSDIEKLLFVYNKDHVLEGVNNGTSFHFKNKIYVNFYLNISDKVKIKFKKEEKKEPEPKPSPEPDRPDTNPENKDDNINTIPYLIIIIIAVIALLLILVIAFIIFKKKRNKGRKSNQFIEEGTKSLEDIKMSS